jgi:hypothetical protein
MTTNLINRQTLGLWLALTVSAFAHAQQPSGPTASPQAAAPALTTPTQTAAQLHDIATVLTGKEPASGLPAPIRDNLKWKIYSKEVQNNWAEYTKTIGEPMVNWAKQHLAASTDTVFYPFSGPDFTTVYQLFPDAKRYVMVAMQNAGHPMDLGAHSPLITDQSLEQLTSAWKLYGTHGFFVTSYLERYYYASQGKIGASTFLAIFLKLQGFDIERVTPISVNANGEVQELPVATKLWTSVRFNATKNGKPIILDYLKIDLSNPGLQAAPVHFKFVQNMSVNPTMFKAASHLPQNSNFNMIAKAILDNAPLVVQDETALNYTALNEKFNVTLFGKFVIAHHAFQSYHQDLARAFAQRQDVNPLNFRFGYYKDGNYVLMIARRR